MSLILKEAGPDGYDFSEKDLEIMSKSQVKRTVAVSPDDTEAPMHNLIDLPELYLSAEEKKEVFDKTIGNVLKKL